ncbi:unnamed protein product [Staurois parvus]|uniref:Uncharacterized protein n=2 Tax=Staurois parvus TaxID=386267 RepID=A0ABN9ECK0_9NEOB|nr:unnamed protein product [Staurois parvus]
MIVNCVPVQFWSELAYKVELVTKKKMTYMQGQTDHLETRALPEGPGSVGGPMRCPWYLFHRLF